MLIVVVVTDPTGRAMSRGLAGSVYNRWRKRRQGTFRSDAVGAALILLTIFLNRVLPWTTSNGQYGAHQAFPTVRRFPASVCACARACARSCVCVWGHHSNSKFKLCFFYFFKTVDIGWHWIYRHWFQSLRQHYWMGFMKIVFFCLLWKSEALPNKGSNVQKLVIVKKKAMWNCSCELVVI